MTLGTTLKRAAWLLLALVLAALAWLKLVHGGGEAHADLSTPPLHPASRLQTLATLELPPGNVAVSADGRVFFNLHPFAQAQRFGVGTVYELVDGQPRPWPDAAAQAGYQGVFGMTVDRQQRLWFIEPAELDHERTRLSAWDLVRNRKVYEHTFEPGVLRFAQDLRVTPDGTQVVLADTGLFKFTPPAIAVFTPATGRLLQRLRDHPSTQPQDLVTQTPFGPHKLAGGLVSFLVGVDGIVLSADGQWLVYAAMNHARLYRVPMAALADPAVPDARVAALVEDLGPKPLSDGITLDHEGRVILTDIEHGGLMRREADGRLQTLVRDERIVWADGVVQAPDGSLLFTDSAIPAYLDPLARPPSQARLKAGRPYRLLRLPP
jgi:sugar lactone lactonase YvrE